PGQREPVSHQKRIHLSEGVFIQFIHTPGNQTDSFVVKVLIDMVKDVAGFVVVRMVLHTKVNEGNPFFMKGRMVRGFRPIIGARARLIMSKAKRDFSALSSLL